MTARCASMVMAAGAFLAAAVSAAAQTASTPSIALVDSRGRLAGHPLSETIAFVMVRDGLVAPAAIRPIYDADARTASDASLTSGVSCDDLGCVMQSAGGGLIAQAFRPEALSDDCERAALIVTLRQAPAACAASVIDAERLRRQGAMVLRQGREGLVVEAAKPRGIDRPWSPAAADESETDATILAPRVVPPRAVDATPAEADLQADE